VCGGGLVLKSEKALSKTVESCISKPFNLKPILDADSNTEYYKDNLLVNWVSATT
jgi:hypothetical protein